jgi:hypothetical protein
VEEVLVAVRGVASEKEPWRRWWRITRRTAATCARATCSGTLSGPDATEAGSLLELSQGGKRPIQFSNGESRTFQEDGDTVIPRGYCQREGARRIGFGECRGTVLPARD